MNEHGALRPLDSLFSDALRTGIPSVIARPKTDKLDAALDPRLAPGTEHLSLEALLARPPRREIV